MDHVITMLRLFRNMEGKNVCCAYLQNDNIQAIVVLRWQESKTKREFQYFLKCHQHLRGASSGIHFSGWFLTLTTSMIETYSMYNLIPTHFCQNWIHHDKCSRPSYSSTSKVSTKTSSGYLKPKYFKLQIHKIY